MPRLLARQGSGTLAFRAICQSREGETNMETSDTSDLEERRVVDRDGLQTASDTIIAALRVAGWEEYGWDAHEFSNTLGFTRPDGSAKLAIEVEWMNAEWEGC